MVEEMQYDQENIENIQKSTKFTFDFTNSTLNQASQHQTSQHQTSQQQNIGDIQFLTLKVTFFYYILF